MIRKLQKRFIGIAMLSLLSVMLILVAAINVIYIRQSRQTQDDLFDWLYQKQQLEALPNKLPDSSFDRPDSPEPEKRFFEPVNAPSIAQYCIVTLSADRQISDIVYNIVDTFSEETAVQYANTILSQNRLSGSVDQYHYRLYETESSTLLIILDSGFMRTSIRMIFFISLSVAVISYLIVFLLVVLFSKRAIRPIAESYEKQKQFITDASHELKTPLTVISANTEIARMCFGNCEWFDGIDKQTVKMQNLIKHLISLSKMDEENTQLNMAPFSITDAAADTVSVYSQLSDKAGKKMCVDIEKNLIYTGDEASIRQVLAILLDNALKYCSDGGEIQVSLKKGRYITLAVSNTCSVLDSLSLDRIFDRFYRGDKARSSGNGYGIGLSIAKAIAERHNSTIKVCKEGDSQIMFEVILK